MFSLELTSAPATEPITTAEAKTYCRVDVSTHDTLIGLLVTAARQQAEARLRRQIVTATWKLRLDAFPIGSDPIEVPRPPLSSVSSIAYVDTDGATQTWSSSEYQVDAYTHPGRIVPAYGYSYPATRPQMNAVTVTFVAGYGAAASVPELLKTALKAMVCDWFENRLPVGQVGDAAARLLADFKWGNYR